MTLFVQQLAIVLPIFLLIGIGFAMHKGIGLEQRTLNKLNFWLFAPALLFVELAKTESITGELVRIAGFTFVHLVIMFVLGWKLFSRGTSKKSRPVFAMGTAFMNCGNYGIPLVVLAFGQEFVGLLAILIMVQGLACFLSGTYMFEGGADRHPVRALVAMMRLPIVWAVVLGLGASTMESPVPGPLMRTFEFLAGAMIPVALLTLGTELARQFKPKEWRGLTALTLLRLFVSPAVALVVALLFGFRGDLLAMLVAVTALPMAVNIYIVAAEYDADTVLASEGIVVTTLLSPLTVAVVLALMA